MKTALEIKKDVHRFRTCTEESIIESMDSYAEQMAIGFHNWKEEHFAGVDGVTTKELYQLYLKSIEK